MRSLRFVLLVSNNVICWANKEGYVPIDSVLEFRGIVSNADASLPAWTLLSHPLFLCSLTSLHSRSNTLVRSLALNFIYRTRAPRMRVQALTSHAGTKILHPRLQ